MATAGMWFAVNGDAAFVTDAHAAKWGARLAGDGVAEGRDAGDENSGGDGGTFLDGDGPPIHC